MKTLADTKKEITRLFHDTYEQLALSFGYETRPDTKEFDPKSPNGKLMIAVVSKVLDQAFDDFKEVVKVDKTDLPLEESPRYRKECICKYVSGKRVSECLGCTFEKTRAYNRGKNKSIETMEYLLDFYEGKFKIKSKITKKN